MGELIMHHLFGACKSLIARIPPKLGHHLGHFVSFNAFAHASYLTLLRFVSEGGRGLEYLLCVRKAGRIGPRKILAKRVLLPVEWARRCLKVSLDHQRSRTRLFQGVCGGSFIDALRSQNGGWYGGSDSEPLLIRVRSGAKLIVPVFLFNSDWAAS